MEDNEINRRLFTNVLKKLGHSVVTAVNGRDALDTLQRTEVDVALMDVQMPEMDGIQATAAIRAGERSGSRHLPIVAMTAHAMRGDCERFLRAGMDGYISKPIDTAALIQCLERVASHQPAAAVAAELCPGPAPQSGNRRESPVR